MTTKLRCPSQDPCHWKPQDVLEVKCQHCGASLEFFRDDETRTCPGCGREVPKPKQG